MDVEEFDRYREASERAYLLSRLTSEERAAQERAYDEGRAKWVALFGDAVHARSRPTPPTSVTSRPLRHDWRFLVGTSAAAGLIALLLALLIAHG